MDILAKKNPLVVRETAHPLYGYLIKRNDASSIKLWSIHPEITYLKIKKMIKFPYWSIFVIMAFNGLCVNDALPFPDPLRVNKGSKDIYFDRESKER